MKAKPNILFISHDANRAGAQIFLFNIMKYFKTQGFGVVLLLINDWGSFRSEFESEFDTFFMQKKDKKRLPFFKEKTALDLISDKYNINLVYANTIVSAEILETIHNHFKKPIITHIHELGYSIQQYGVEKAIEIINQFSARVIACSDAVSKNLIESFPKIANKISVVHSFVDNEAILKIHNESKKQEKTHFTIGACGNADWRKAPDIFLLIAKKVYDLDKTIKFTWIGIDHKSELFKKLKYDTEKFGLNNQINWLNPSPNAIQIINNDLDVFMVCSREDPFPLVMLEAAICEKPIVGFRNTGGADEFIEDNAGILCDYLDIDGIANAIIKIKNDQNLKDKYGVNAQKKVLELYSFDISVHKIQDEIMKLLP